MPAWSEWPELGTSERHCRTLCCLGPPGPEAVRPERAAEPARLCVALLCGWADRGSRHLNMRRQAVTSHPTPGPALMGVGWSDTAGGWVAEPLVGVEGYAHHFTRRLLHQLRPKSLLGQAHPHPQTNQRAIRQQSASRKLPHRQTHNPKTPKPQNFENIFS